MVGMESTCSDINEGEFIILSTVNQSGDPTLAIGETYGLLLLLSRYGNGSQGGRWV